MAEMNDIEFLRYVDAHSRSERHAFHVDHARRLMALARVDELRVDDCGLPNFVGIDMFEAVPLVERAIGFLEAEGKTRLGSTDAPT